tara:strand:+ start:707 stop:1702 length:996 start_codon:yes stop_codon:yes gene_type:complete
MNIPITVLMSVYNDEHFLNDSINSVLNQSFIKFEFIIVNDGSTDSSLKIINQFALLDNRIKVINKSNSGSYDSLNLGIEQAKGDWISIIDSDDVYESHKLESQYSYSQLNKSVNLIGSNYITINDKGEKLKTYKVSTSQIILKDNLSKRKLFFPHSSFFYKKELAILNKYRAEIFLNGGDYDFGLRFSEMGDIACIDSFLVQIRKHSRQTSVTNAFRQLTNSKIAQISHLIRKKGYPDPIKQKKTDELFIKFFNFLKQDKKLQRLNNFQFLILQIKYLLLNLNLRSFIKLSILVFKLPLAIFHYAILYLSGRKIDDELVNKWINRNYNEKK